MNVLADAYGRTLEYEITTELAPARPELGRRAKVEAEWQDFKGFVGKPFMAPGETDPAKMFPNLATLHTTRQLDPKTRIRYGDRTYAIVNFASDPEHGLGMYRYDLRATLDG